MILRLAALLVALALAAPAAEARPLRWARSIDVTSLDPHAANTGPNILLLHQIYEPLIIRRFDGQMTPALALSWSITRDPTVWEFKLRPGVRFQDGAAFDADDVLYSLERARGPGSDMRSLLASIESVTKVDASTIRIRTRGPDPLLPNSLTDVFILDRGWGEANGIGQPREADGPAASRTNGTGPYRLVSREPGSRTVMARNEAYWGKGEVPLAVSEIVYRVIPDAHARVAALVAGEVDYVQDVPANEVRWLEGASGIRVRTSPENRSIFLGLKVGGRELASSDVKGRNPFADRRVREAVNLAVDREALRRGVMRGLSAPAGVIVPPFSAGYSRDLDRVTLPDPARARALLTEAGLPNGFSVKLHCTDDRYVSDAELCGALAEMLTAVGIRTTSVTRPAAEHFPEVRRGELDLYLLGWGVTTFDSEYIFSGLYHTNAGGLGNWNGTGFADPSVDAAIRELRREIDPTPRGIAMLQLWRRLKAEMIYVPLHNQVIAQAMRIEFDIPTDVSNQPKMKFIDVMP
jgi:peptide/nickel transport system substrate-binding protein